jgi:hypothetical protein
MGERVDARECTGEGVSRLQWIGESIASGRQRFPRILECGSQEVSYLRSEGGFTEVWLADGSQIGVFRDTGRWMTRRLGALITGGASALASLCRRHFGADQRFTGRISGANLWSPNSNLRGQPVGGFESFPLRHYNVLEPTPIRGLTTPFHPLEILQIRDRVVEPGGTFRGETGWRMRRSLPVMSPGPHTSQRLNFSTLIVL